VLKLSPASQPPGRGKSLGRHIEIYAAGLTADRLAGRGNREALAAFRPSALQHLAAVLRGHPNQESMRLLAAAAVRLKCTFALHGFWKSPAAILNGAEKLK
jgi:hypothetical protein